MSSCPDRSDTVARLGTLEREGVTFALHSDYPQVVVPMLPLTAVYAAVTRIAEDDKTVIAPDEAIGVERALFFGGWGAQRFSNVSFVAPPSGVLPPTIFGAITNVNLDPVTLTFMVFDPNDQTNNYWPNDLFGDGVNLSAGVTYATTISDRPTTFNLTGTYSTKTGDDLNDFLLPPEVEGGTQQQGKRI